MRLAMRSFESRLDAVGGTQLAASAPSDAIVDASEGSDA
jgi:hypothetical protein